MIDDKFERGSLANPEAVLVDPSRYEAVVEADLYETTDIEESDTPTGVSRYAHFEEEHDPDPTPRVTKKENRKLERERKQGNKQRRIGSTAINPSQA